ncbi:ABC transporter permease [Spirochaeta cellobiosiphila]|uniref:ABC transporter permease n=1 Tax=Spirochaeta cellobiosiphila TaxID=504483 RepID=UPI000427639D|nr:ABC transporter permease subunit [Spirochaeta cellobiosiphila]
MFAIYKRELSSYFLTPYGYIFMGSFLFISGLLFTIQNLFMNSTQYAEYLGSLISIFTIVIPLLTMKVFADEKKNKTDQLLLTAPVTPVQIVIGKFLAPLTVFLITIGITLIYPIILAFYGNIEAVKIFGSYLGFFLLGGAFLAMGVYISALTDNQASAAITTFGAVLFTWFADFLKPIVPNSPLWGFLFVAVIILLIGYWLYRQSGTIIIPLFVTIMALVIGGAVFFIHQASYASLIAKSISSFSLTSRYTYFPMGLLKLSDAIYYLSFALFFLFMTTRLIEKRSWTKEA